MRAIWKFPLSILQRSTIIMPKGAQVLCVQLQDTTPCIWALIPDTEAPVVDRHFAVFGTGHPVDLVPGFQYLGTFQFAFPMPLVFHVFEEPK
jgi:hypothetical protein